MLLKDLISAKDKLVDASKAGIYIIYCAAYDRVYIGQSVKIHKRLLEHKAALKRGTHKNYLLQEAFNLFGDTFLYLPIENCDEEKLTEREIFYASLLKTERKFNLAAITKQVTASIEYRKRCSDSQKGRTFSAEAKEKMSKARKGRILSEEWRRKISESNKGKHNFKHTEEAKKKMKKTIHKRKISKGVK